MQLAEILAIATASFGVAGALGYRYVNKIKSALSSEIASKYEIEQKLKLASSVFKHSTEGIVITDANSVILEVNETFERLTGFSRSEAIGHKPNILKSGKHNKAFYEKMYEEIHQNGCWQGEIWNKNKSGSLYAELLSISSIKDEDGNVINFVAMFNDITQNKESQDKLAYLVNFDPLTGLANRRFLLERLGHALQLSKRSHRLVGLIFIDLDNFKYVNDTLGHKAGDELLLQIVERLNSIIRESDTLARMGGDEFVLLVENIQNQENLAILANKIVETIAPSYNIENTQVFTSASVGVSMYPTDGDNIDELMKKADMAMYQSKERGKNQFYFFSEDLENELKHRLLILSQVREGLANKELFMLFQPQVDLREGSINGLEALLRWNHPTRGLITPEEFIHFVDSDNLIHQLSEMVIVKAFMAIKQLDKQGIEIGSISINIADGQFRDRQFVQKMQNAIEFFQINAAKVKIELSESSVTYNLAESISKLNALRELGLKIAIDSFGTGYASIGHIKNFPVDELKIDTSFVKNIGTGHIDDNLVSAMIAMGKALGIESVAVGVENETQVGFLLDKGCYIAQGYYFFEPKSIEELVGIIKSSS